MHSLYLCWLLADLQVAQRNVFMQRSLMPGQQVRGLVRRVFGMLSLVTDMHVCVPCCRAYRVIMH